MKNDAKYSEPYVIAINNDCAKKNEKMKLINRLKAKLRSLLNINMDDLASRYKRQDTSCAQPIIIIIHNKSDRAVKRVDLFGAQEYLKHTGFKDGSLTIDGVTISNGVPNVTYQQLLNHMSVHPFKVGLTYIQSVSGCVQQIVAPFVITEKDEVDKNGYHYNHEDVVIKTIVPVLDPLQNQRTIVAVTDNYSIDGYTKLTFNCIEANTEILLQFYPQDIPVVEPVQENKSSNKKIRIAFLKCSIWFLSIFQKKNDNFYTH